MIHCFFTQSCFVNYRSAKYIVPVIAVVLVLVGTFSFSVQPAQAASDWFVSPGGAGNKSGTAPENAFASLQAALDQAQPGDVIHLSAGHYYENIVTKRHGIGGQPISLVGPRDAVLHGVKPSSGNDRVFQIFHDYYVLDGWTVDGYDGSGNTADDYRDKLIYVHGQREPYGKIQRGPQGLEIKNMLIQNAGGECIRLRYFVTGANIHHNAIRNCGIHDFRFAAGGVNGEGIYIGTSSNQWNDGKNPSAHPDGSHNNWIHDNSFDTQGNECVEVKEGGEDNIIENNNCTGGKDPNAAGLASRGDGNTFRSNETYGHVGGGVRFGGHVINGHTYGVNNSAYLNRIYNNKAGGIKFEETPQAQICGNLFTAPTGETQANAAYGSYGKAYLTQVTAPCPAVTPSVSPTTPPTVTPTVTPTPVVSPTVTPNPKPTDDGPGIVVHKPIYVSSSTDGVADGVQFRDEDIMAFDLNTYTSYLVFDGSDVGITNDVDAFALTAHGTILLSLQDAATVPSVGSVDDSDILEFTPTFLGHKTAGAFTLYFDGSDVGLSADGEDVDGIALLPDGTLVLSTKGDIAVKSSDGKSLNAKNEDLMRFTPTQLGATTAGAWSLYFDGSDLQGPTIGLNTWEVWIGDDGLIYIATESAITGAKDDSVDVYVCQPVALGENTNCTLSLFWDGASNHFGDKDERIDGLDLGPTSITVESLTTTDETDPLDGQIIDVGLEDYAENDYAPVDSDDSEPELAEDDPILPADDVQTPRIYLPLITR